MKFKKVFNTDDFLMHINSFNSKVILLGDFNVHVDISHKPDVKHFLSSTQSSGFFQHVSGSTHKHGHTLDLLFSRPEDDLVKDVIVGTRLSDHHFILCTLSFQKPDDVKKVRATRNFREIDQESMNKDLATNFDLHLSESTTIDKLVSQYNNTIKDALYKFAPISERTRSSRVRQPWYTSDIHKARRKRRRLEKQWRKSKYEVHHELYIEQNKLVNSMIDDAKVAHYKAQLKDADTKSVFKLVNGLLNKTKKILPNHNSEKQLADDFATFFSKKLLISTVCYRLNKIDLIMMLILSFDETVSCHLTHFDLLNDDDVVDLISKSATKSCVLDPIPTWYVKQNLPTFVYVIKCIINMSLSTGVFPDVLKQAIINPIIKKQTLDANVFKNYRPVANIPFISKLIDKHVFKCINEHMDNNNLGENLQSAYRPRHRTETALLHVKNNIMHSIHNQQGVFLVLLDLSAAFDTVEHSILVSRMANEVGLRGIALEWYKSYFNNRSTKVCINDTFSDCHHMDYGFPQGSIVGPGSFKIYIIPIGRIIRKHSISYHMYADDIQIFLDFKPSDPTSIETALSRLSACIFEIKVWMTKNMLKLNDSKTEFFVAISHYSKRKLSLDVQLQIGAEIIHHLRLYVT